MYVKMHQCKTRIVKKKLEDLLAELLALHLFSSHLFNMDGKRGKMNRAKSLAEKKSYRLSEKHVRYK